MYYFLWNWVNFLTNYCYDLEKVLSQISKFLIIIFLFDRPTPPFNITNTNHT